MKKDSNLQFDEAIAASVDNFKCAATNLPIRYLGDEVLRTVCTEVASEEFGTESTKDMITNLTEVLMTYRARFGSGRGLAANQIGYIKRAAILWVDDKPLALLNLKNSGFKRYSQLLGIVFIEWHAVW